MQITPKYTFKTILFTLQIPKDETKKLISTHAAVGGINNGITNACISGIAVRRKTSIRAKFPCNCNSAETELHAETSDFQFTKHSPHTLVLCSFLILIVSLGALARDEKLSWNFLTQATNKRDVHIHHRFARNSRSRFSGKNLADEPNDDVWWIMPYRVQAIRKHNCQCFFMPLSLTSMRLKSLACVWNYIMHATHLEKAPHSIHTHIYACPTSETPFPLQLRR